MDMKMGASYVTANRVVEFEENRVIAWCHWARFVWRYELTPQGDGTLVTESFDFRKPWGLPLTLLDWAGKTTRSITATLERLEKLVS